MDAGNVGVMQSFWAINQLEKNNSSNKTYNL